MTSVAASGAESRTRGRLLRLAFVLSVTLNVFFVGGLIWSRATAERVLTPAERFQQMAKDLNLSEDQRDAFQQFVIEVRQGTRKLREHNHPLVDRVWDELGKPQVDQELIARLVDEAKESRRAYQRQMTGAVARFLASLSPPQRAEFVSLAKTPQDKASAHLRRLLVP